MDDVEAPLPFNSCSSAAPIGTTAPLTAPGGPTAPTGPPGCAADTDLLGPICRSWLADEDEVDDDFDEDSIYANDPLPEPVVAPVYQSVQIPELPEEPELQLCALTPASIGEFLRTCRRHVRLSQRELADASGVPRSTVIRLESGRTGDVLLSTLVRLAETCDVMLVGATDEWEPLVRADLSQQHRDAAERCLPAHLRNQPSVTPMGTPVWWGYNCRPKLDRTPPERTFSRRPRRRIPTEPRPPLLRHHPLAPQPPIG